MHVCVFPYKWVRQSLYIWCLSRTELHLLVSLSVCVCVGGGGEPHQQLSDLMKRLAVGINIASIY